MAIGRAIYSVGLGLRRIIDPAGAYLDSLHPKLQMQRKGVGDQILEPGAPDLATLVPDEGLRPDLRRGRAEVSGSKFEEAYRAAQSEWADEAIACAKAWLSESSNTDSPSIQGHGWRVDGRVVRFALRKSAVVTVVLTTASGGEHASHARLELRRGASHAEEAIAHLALYEIAHITS